MRLDLSIETLRTSVHVEQIELIVAGWLTLRSGYNGGPPIPSASPIQIPPETKPSPPRLLSLIILTEFQGRVCFRVVEIKKALGPKPDVACRAISSMHRVGATGDWAHVGFCMSRSRDCQRASRCALEQSMTMHQTDGLDDPI